MDYSFLDDPGAISEILASAEPEHRAMQRARRWNHKTLALHIATNRHRESVLRDEKAHAQEEKPVFVSTFLPFCPVSFWSQLVYSRWGVETRFYLFHGPGHFERFWVATLQSRPRLHCHLIVFI